MKKILKCIMICITILSLSSCNGSSKNNDEYKIKEYSKEVNYDDLTDYVAIKISIFKMKFKEENRPFSIVVKINKKVIDEEGKIITYTTNNECVLENNSKKVKIIENMATQGENYSQVVNLIPVSNEAEINSFINGKLSEYLYKLSYENIGGFYSINSKYKKAAKYYLDNKLATVTLDMSESTSNLSLNINTNIFYQSYIKSDYAFTYYKSILTRQYIETGAKTIEEYIHTVEYKVN